MNFSELKNKQFFWLIVAFFTGALMWSGPSFLQNVGPDHGKMIVLVSLVLFSFGAVAGYYQNPEPWKLALASILSLPLTFTGAYLGLLANSLVIKFKNK